MESCCGSAGPARRSGAATSESPHLGNRSGEQPREYSAGRVVCASTAKRARASGWTHSCPAGARSGVTDGAAGSTPRSSRTGRLRSGIPSEGERAAPRNRRARASRGVETCQKPSSLGSVLVLLQLRLSLCKAPPRRNGATIQRYVRRHEYLLTPLDRGAPWNSTTVDG